jgi:hypothetical protein
MSAVLIGQELPPKDRDIWTFVPQAANDFF